MKGTLLVTPEKVMASASEFAYSAKDIKRITDQMLNIVKSLNPIWEGTPSSLYIRKFYALDNDMQQIYRKIIEHSKDLREMSATYQKAEDYNVSLASALRTDIITAGAGAGSIVSDTQKGGSQADAGSSPTKKGFGGEGAVAQGAVQGGISVLPGLSAEGSASGNLLGYSYETTGGISSKVKVDDKTGKTNIEELGIGYGITGEVHGATGNAKGRVGLSSGEVNGSVGKISGTGTIGATLFKDGKFSPQIGGTLKGKASVLEGDVTVSTGTENNNIHTKASGEVLTAEGEVNVGVGKITYTDAKGNQNTGFGVQAEVGGGAYLASGKVESGITILGVDIDVGISGHAGGASAKVGGYATAGGARGKLDLGLGAGFGLDISIDWSGFKFGW